MSDTIATAAAVVETHEVTREFKLGAITVRALRGVDLFISPGAFVALRGRSGSGKTTLLNILVGLDDPTQGRVMTLGHDLAQLNEARRAALRRESIGLLFQNAHLFPTLTARKIVQLFQDIVQQTGIALLVATHDATVYSAADRVLQISDGRIG